MKVKDQASDDLAVAELDDCALTNPYNIVEVIWNTIGE